MDRLDLRQDVLTRSIPFSHLETALHLDVLRQSDILHPHNAFHKLLLSLHAQKGGSFRYVHDENQELGLSDRAYRLAKLQVPWQLLDVATSSGSAEKDPRRREVLVRKASGGFSFVRRQMDCGIMQAQQRRWMDSDLEFRFA